MDRSCLQTAMVSDETKNPSTELFFNIARIVGKKFSTFVVALLRKCIPHEVIDSQTPMIQTKVGKKGMKLNAVKLVPSTLPFVNKLHISFMVQLAIVFNSWNIIVQRSVADVHSRYAVFMKQTNTRFDKV